jgi:trigger factor
MQITETSTEGLKREFTVIVPADDIETKLVAKLTELGTSVKVPGFRPGKVPLALLKNRYGQSVRGEVLQQTVQDSWQQAMEDKGIRPATEPKIEIVKFEDGSDLEYTLAVELMPDIGDPDFSKLKLERLKVSAQDSEIDVALERMAEQQRKFEAVAESRAAVVGDQVLIDFVGRIDGEEFDGGTMSDFELEIGSDRFLPGFEDKLIAIEPGGETEFQIDVAADHPSEKLRGKAIDFAVTVKEVREAQPVSIDDALAQTVGLQTLDALKTSIREQMEREYAVVSRARLKRGLLDDLANSYDFDVPPGIVEREFEAIWKEVKTAMDKDELDQDDKDKSEDELRTQYEDIAVRRVRLGMLLAEVGRKNNISVSQDELNREMQREAARFPGQEANIFEYFQKNPEAMQSIHAPLFEDKVVDFIIALADLTEREVTIDELMAEPEEAVSAKSQPKAKAKSKPNAKNGGKGKTKSGAKPKAAGKSADKNK